MKEIFRHDSPFMVGLRRFFLLVQLNILWAICCLPVVTIGAATVSMYRTVAALRTDMEAGEETVELFSFFFLAFRQEFRQSTLLMLVKLAAVALLAADFRVAAIVADGLSGAVKLICWIPTVLFALVSGVVFPLQAKFSNTVFQTAKNAALIAFSNPSVSISVAFLNAIPVLLFLKAPEFFIRTFLFWIAIGVSGICWLNWMMLNRVFQKYIPEETDTTQEVTK